MTDEEKIRKCVELVWDYEEIYEEEDLLDFQSNELSTYSQHNNIINKLNQYEQLEKENAECKDKLEKLKIEIERLRQKSVSRRSTINVLNTRLKARLEQVERLKGENKGLREQIEEYEKMLKYLN